MEATAGAKSVYFGAIVQFQVIGHAHCVAASLRNWVTFMSRGPDGNEMASILGLLSLFKRVSGTPAKSQGTRAYAVDLGTNVVSDAQIAKTLGMCVRAAVNAAHDLDPEKSARIVRVHLELSETSGNMSRLHIQTVGELGTKAKAGCCIDGRQHLV